MKHLIPLFILSLRLVASAAVPVKWDVDLAAQPPQVFTLQRPRGETYELEAVLKRHGKPFEPAINSACIYWQTNGMENLYWSAPASVSNNVLRATWLPSMDPGATTVRGYIGDPGHIYATAFQFRFIASPGETPNELPLPQKVIDFAKVTVLNPPWSGGGGGVDTNAVRDIVREQLATNGIRKVDGTLKMLPKYLWEKYFDDSYPEDAEWYYRQPQPHAACSAVRDGGFLYRNYDWKFDDAAEFVVRMSSRGGDIPVAAKRFASVGVANVGTNLTEEIVTSGQPSRFYKCLPGHTVDGINENGVVCEVNVVDGDPHDYWPTNGTIHCLGAVRRVLDNATNAASAASLLAAGVYFPSGFSQNFHWMVADERETWVVENGAASNVAGRVVMTNFRLIPKTYGPGWERYMLLEDTFASITNAWYTRAYSRETEWVSEFKTPAEMEAAKQAWETHGREELRGKGLWQTLHTSVYDITNRTLRIAVQETDDWYVFQVPATGAKADAYTKAETDAKLAEKQNVALGYISRHGSSTVEEELQAIDIDLGYATGDISDLKDSKVTLQPMSESSPETGDIDVSGVVMGRVDVMTEGAPGRYHSLREKADRSMISATDPTFSNEVATVARTVTPQPSPTLRVYDEVRQCWWIGRMVNGVINWEVE